MADSNAGLFEVEPLVAPDAIFGKLKTPGGFTKSVPREWTQSEVSWALEQKQKGYSVNELAEALGRTPVSVQIKLKRLTKKADTYNSRNRNTKYEANDEFLRQIKPESVLDVYAGNSWWREKVKNTITNDKDASFGADYQLDALDLLCTMKLQKKKFDLIDLDPYGSAYECFDLACKLAKKAVVVSFGEWGHKRWKRVDFVKHRYGIVELDAFEPDTFIAEFQRIASCNKKEAKAQIVLRYDNFVRVYFVLSEIKVTEQWESLADTIKRGQADNHDLPS